MRGQTKHGLSWAGLAAGAAAWAFATQVNYTFATVRCDSSFIALLATTIACLAVASAGFALSWRAWNDRGGPEYRDDVDTAEPHRLLAGVSVLGAGLFGLVLLTYVVAIFLLGCK